MYDQFVRDFISLTQHIKGEKIAQYLKFLNTMNIYRWKNCRKSSG